MEVILLQDIPKVGRKGEVKNVANGFARNKLLPAKLAEMATLQKIAEIQKEQARSTEKAQIDQELLLKNIESLSEKTITLTEKANEKGHLFSGLHKEDVAKAVKEQTGLAIPQESIMLEDPIKETGEHSIAVKAGEEERTFTFNVLPA